jgi:hypothetical protein
MQHEQTHHLFNEAHTLYFQDKHSTLIHKQRLNYQRPKRAVTGQQTSDNFYRPMLLCHKNQCINEESTNTVKQNNF